MDPHIIVRRELTEDSKYDISLGDIQNLLVSILSNKNTPKTFEIRHKVCIRSVVVLHILSDSTHSSDCQESHRVKITSGRRNPCSDDDLLQNFLSYRLLTVSLRNDTASVVSLEEPKSESTTQQCPPSDKSFSGYSNSTYLSLLPYVLSPAIMRLWGYPLDPLMDDSVQPSQPPSKESLKRKQSFDEVDIVTATATSTTVVGVLKGSLPSVSEANEYLHRIESSQVTPTVFSVRHKPPTAPTSSSSPSSYDSFYRTFPVSSASYHSLTPPSINHIIPLDIAVIDCEMCDTLSGPQLTRLSLLDSAGQTLLDTLVRPAEPILNYRTEFSGLTEKDLQPVSVTTCWPCGWCTGEWRTRRSSSRTRMASPDD